MTRQPVGALQPALAGRSDALAAPRRFALRKNVGWSLAGNLVYATCQWGALVVVARLGTPELVGQFALGLAIATPIMLLANLQLRGVQATDARRAFELKHYLTLRLITTLLGLLAVGLLCALLGYSIEAAAVVMAVALMKAADSLSDVFYGLFDQHERMRYVARSLVLRGVSSVAALSGVLAATGSLPLAVGAVAAVWLAMTATHDVPAAASLVGWDTLRREHFAWRPGPLARLAWLAAPVGVAAAVVSLEISIPRYVVQCYLGDRELGIFAAVAWTFVAANLVINAVHHPAIPRLARLAAVQDGVRFRRLLGKLLAVGMLIGAGVLVGVAGWGARLLVYGFGPEYAARQDVFLWLAGAFAVRYVSLPASSALRAMQFFWTQFAVHMSGLACLTAFCLAWIPQRGILGAGQACLAATLVNAVVYGACLWRAMHSRFDADATRGHGKFPQTSRRPETIPPGDAPVSVFSG